MGADASVAWSFHGVSRDETAVDRPDNARCSCVEAAHQQRLNEDSGRNRILRSH